MLPTLTRPARAGLVLVACLAAVIGMLALPRQSAHAADGCTGPFSIGVSGPNGSSTTQPGGMPVQLTALAADGTPASRLCPGATVTFEWSTLAPNIITSADGNAATVVGQTGRKIPFTVTIAQQRSSTAVTLELTFTYLRPALSIEPAPTAGAPTTLTVVPNSAAADSSGPIYGLRWNFGDGTTGSSDTLSVTHVYSTPGSYFAQVALFSPLRQIDTATGQVPVHAPLTAAFTAPDTGTVGAAVPVDGTSSTGDPDASITGYSWDFGDGGRATGASPTHVYWTTGAFTITETVTDSLGRTAGTAHGITVSPGSTGAPAPPGTPPVASFTTTTANPTAASPVSFDGTGSSDSDGSIVAYAWTFGDDGTATGATPQHAYAHPGSYPVTLTVTDDSGLTRSATQLVSVADAAPTARFTSAPDAVAGSATAFDGTGSADPDGSVQSYAWDFGDGATATGPTPTHTYARAGSYDVVLTVIDDAGLTATATHTVDVAKAAPTAAFPVPPGAVAGSPVSFDGTPSSDVDGTVQQYAWDFGDGQGGTGATPAHTYARAGQYTVTLTVTDDDGLTGATTRSLDVATAPPVAAFTAPAGAAGVSMAFDGTGSTDSDGSIVDYRWDFGDGGRAIGATPGHTFAQPNTYPVTLSVMDDAGAWSSVTHLVTVGTAVPSAVFVPSASAPSVGSSVAFDGSGSTAPGGAIAGYTWTFGDGGTGTGVNPSHTYTSPGSYPVTLTVTDAAGNTASVSHVVSAHWPATDLAVAVAGATPKAGQYAYRVTVKNLGHTGAHGIVLTNLLDTHQVLASAVQAPAGLVCGGVPVGSTGTITCKATSATVLAAGKSWVVTFTVKQPAKAQARQVSETSTVRAANPDPLPKNNTAHLTTGV